jgi:NADPH:quinone reductase-like Zn-dependent oxidoreductase
MRVVQIDGGFGLDRLRPADRPDPVPGPGQVLLRLHAAALNYRDLLTVRGEYNPKYTLPLVPCSDGCGEILAVGDGVKRVTVGERVLPIFAQRWIAGRPTRERLRSTLGGPLDGTLAEQIVLDAEGVVPAPEHLTPEAAATLPCAGVTAWSALVEGAVQPGDTVLLQGTGGVSLFALQLVQLFGARAIVTSSSEAKLERARALGAWATLHYPSTPDWGKQAWRLADGGVDLVVEVGGAETLEQSLAAVRPGGTICLLGVLAGATASISLTSIFMQQVRVQGLLVGPRENLEALVRAVTRHRLQPIVDSTFELDAAREAFDHLAAGRHFGKVALRIP